MSANDTTNLYDQIVNLLKAEGFKLGLSERKSDFVSTKFKVLDKYKYRLYDDPLVYYNFSITGNTIKINGWWQSSNLSHKVAYEDQYPPAWQEMDRLAKLLGTVTYSREK